MRLRRVVMASLLSAAAVGFGSVLLHWPNAWAHGGWAESDGGDSGWRQRWSQRGHGGGHFCRDGDKGMDRVLEWARWELALTPGQSDAFERLAQAGRGAGAKMASLCADQKADAAQTSAPDRLAGLEAALAAGLDVVREVRPAFTDFYAVLTAEQRQILDRHLQRRHRG
jgi:hypothetical protein